MRLPLLALALLLNAAPLLAALGDPPVGKAAPAFTVPNVSAPKSEPTKK